MIICFPCLSVVCLFHLMVYLEVPPHQPFRDTLLISMINATEVIKYHRLSNFFGDGHADHFQSFIVISNVLSIRHVYAHVFSVRKMSARGSDELKTDLYQTWQNHSFVPKQICRQESALPSWVYYKWTMLFVVTVFLLTKIVTSPGSTVSEPRLALAINRVSSRLACTTDWSSVSKWKKKTKLKKKG